MKEFFSSIFYYPFLNLLMFITWLVPGHLMWVTILVLTVFVRTLLIVPIKRGAQSQRKMQQLQPLMNELKEEYGDDRIGLASAQMELYKKNNINPYSSCGFALIQLPILSILYFTFLHGFDVASPYIYSFVPRPEFINSSFLWADLSQRDSLFILPILAAALQLVHTMMTLPPKAKAGTEEDPAVAMQRNIVYILPLVTFFIANHLASGIALYMIVGSIFSIGQQFFVNKERYHLSGVEKVVDKAEKLHPGINPDLQKAGKEVVDTKVDKGVAVTVRKKGK